MYRVVGDVKPPKALSTPDPTYTEIARQSRLQGSSVLFLIVNDRGEPTNIKIVRVLGGGLDDRAVEAVQKWRFKPATLKGVPVAVQ